MKQHLTHAPPTAHIDSREDWLNAAVRQLRPIFFERGYIVPEKIRVSCGFPPGVRRDGRAIQQCSTAFNSSDDHWEIFVSPMLDDPVRVLGALTHDLVHATVGLKAGHRRPFGQCAGAMGLESPWVATRESESFKASIARPVLRAIGVDYPHTKLSPVAPSSAPKKQGTRLCLCECPRCGYKVRTTMKWILSSGGPLCPTEGCGAAKMECDV